MKDCRGNKLKKGDFVILGGSTEAVTRPFEIYQIKSSHNKEMAYIQGLYSSSSELFYACYLKKIDIDQMIKGVKIRAYITNKKSVV